MSSFLDNFTEEEKEDKDGIKTIEYEVDIDKKYKSKKTKRLIIEVLVIAFIIIFIIFTVIYMSKVEVPNFDNQLVSIADKWCSNSDINIIKNEEYSDDYLEGYIIDQSIKKGDRISKGSSLEIVVSKGPNPDEIVKVPDFSTMTGAEIKNWVNENKLSNTTITEQNSALIENGKIISYTFGSVTVDKENFKRSDVLNIIISKGNIQYEKNIEVINLISKTKEEVTKWCTDNNLICNYTEVLSDTYETGKIVFQSVKAQEIISKDQILNFQISAGVGIIVPNYTNVSSENASSINTKFDIKLKFVYNMVTSYGKLISQSVKTGSKKLETDNKIELVYSLGKPYFSSLVGTSVSEIAKIFYEYNQKGVNFTYEIVYVNSDKEKGSVVETSKSNEFVTTSENIIIKVSNGVE